MKISDWLILEGFLFYLLCFVSVNSIFVTFASVLILAGFTHKVMFEEKPKQTLRNIKEKEKK